MPSGSRLDKAERRDRGAAPRDRAPAVAPPPQASLLSETPTPTAMTSLQRLVGNRTATAVLPRVHRVFTDPANLNAHYQKHGGEYPGVSKAGYDALSTELWKQRATLQSKTAANGRIYVYDAANNDFATFNSNGKAITVFKPSGGQGYYNKQV